MSSTKEGNISRTDRVGMTGNRHLREGVFAFRAIIMQHNIASLEAVTNEYRVTLKSKKDSEK